MFKDILIEAINNKQRDLKLEITGETYNFINLISLLNESINDYDRKVLVNFLEKLDNDFKSSRLKKSKYYVKPYHERTILTFFW